MPLQLTWQDITIRLALTVLASGLIGFDRGRSGHAAGLRTTILVGLAASAAMIQANLLLPADGKSSSSFVVLDLMRLPLGILTGVGFIGAGAIFRRQTLITGVTTAATLWVTTVIGLCFGGGQIGLGVATAIIAFVTLGALRWVDERIPREREATIVLAAGFAGAQELQRLLAPHGVQVRLRRFVSQSDQNDPRLVMDISWRQREIDKPPAELLDRIGQSFRVIAFDVAGQAS